MKLTLHIPKDCEVPEEDLKIAALAVREVNRTQRVSTLAKVVLDKLPLVEEPVSEGRKAALDNLGPWLSAPKEEE